MSNLIEVPEDRDEFPDRKVPNWLWIVGAGILIIVLGFVLTFNASSDRSDAKATRDEAVALADEITQACQSGSIPEEYRSVCVSADQTRSEVERIQGERGERGERGSTGPMGPAGPQGLTGPPGPEGADGSDGRDGRTGAQGSTGPRGSSGSDGAAGERGSSGAQGERGPTGAQGPQGERGPTGAQGPQGLPGPPGDPGTLPDSYTVQDPDGRVITCNRNAAPPPDYLCSLA